VQTLIDLAVRRPITTVMLFLCILAVGAVAVIDTDTELLPDIHLPRLEATAVYPGLPPAEIRELITVPLEDALSSTKGLKTISSISRDGRAEIRMELHWGTNVSRSLSEARQIVDALHPRLPAECEKPFVRPADSAEDPMLCLGVLPRDGDFALARRLADREIRTRLQRLDGVGAVQRLGGVEEEIRVLVDQSKAAVRGCTAGRIAEMIGQNHLCYPVGTLTQGAVDCLVEADGRVESVESLGELLLTDAETGTAFQLKEVAEIRRQSKEATTLFQVDGRQAVGLLIHRKAGMSPTAVSRAVRDAVSAMAQTYARDVELRIVKDASLPIASSIRQLAVAVLLGTAAAFFVLMIFLRRITWAAVAAASIPVCLLTALLLLRLSGRSLNVMSLGGFAVGVGLIVDNGIVVLENLIRGLGPEVAVTDGYICRRTGYMASAAFGSTATTVVVFVPVIFLPGILGVLFTDLALAVIYSVAASYFVSVTLVPVLFKLLPQRRFRAKAASLRELPVTPAYRALLLRAARKPIFLAALLCAVAAGGAALLLQVRTELLPAIDGGELRISAEVPPGTSMERLAQTAAAVAEQAQRVEGVQTTFAGAGLEGSSAALDGSTVGAGVVGTGGVLDGGGSGLTLTVLLKNRGRPSVFAVRDALAELLSADAMGLRIGLPRSVLSPLLGRSGTTDILACGSSPEEAAARAEELAESARRLAALSPVRLLPSGTKQELAVTPVGALLARAGVSSAQIADSLACGLTGVPAGRLAADGREMDIRVLLREEDRADLPALRRLVVGVAEGEPLLLGDIASIEQVQRRPWLERRDRRDVVSVRFAGSGLDIPEGLAAFVRSRDGLEPMAASVWRESLPRILVSFGLSVALLYFVLGAQLESFLLPLVLMLAFPLSLSGVLLGLTMAGRSINLSSIMGVFVLLGIAVNNSILLIETYRRRLQAGHGTAAAVFRGSAERLRPILMTMLTTVAALLPVAVDPWHRSAQSSMASAVMGGLFVSTLLTLFVIPVVFLHRQKRRRPFPRARGLCDPQAGPE